MSVGYLPHSFDLFNVAHLDLIAAARARVERLVVGVLSDEDVLARTGRAPVVPLVERVEILRHVRGVEEVVVHGDAAVPADALLLVPTDEAGHEDATAPGAQELPATRTSASPVLRHALRAVSAEAVA